MVENAYIPPELANARKRAQGQKLITFGAIAAGAGCIGALLSFVLKVVWLGILGAPIGFLSSLAVVIGVICMAAGYTQVKSSRNNGNG
jgi:hypothetical protein